MTSAGGARPALPVGAMRLPIMAVAIALLFRPSSPTFAEDMSATQSPAGTYRFLREATAGGLAEIELGKLAEERSGTAAVKDFGRRMVEDHSKSNAQLEALAAQKGVTLPVTLTARHQALRDQLAKLSGVAFDREYMAAMVADHDHDVAAFRRAAASVPDPDVRAFATDTIPTLEAHRAEARRIDGTIAAGAPRTDDDAEVRP